MEVVILLFSSLTRGSLVVHDGCMASYDADSEAHEYDPSGTTGFNGGGKIISTKRTSGSSCFIGGETTKHYELSMMGHSL